MVMQSPNLFPHLNVRANIEFGNRARRPAYRNIELQQLIDVLQLRSFLDRRPQTLSGGEQSRVALGRALASGPRMLLMDEPLASLDEAARGEILDYLARVIAEWKVPTLLVTHHRREAVAVADQILEIDAGAARIGQRFVGKESDHPGSSRADAVG
jgi:molybdate transport system ATP-binding protein